MPWLADRLKEPDNGDIHALLAAARDLKFTAPAATGQGKPLREQRLPDALQALPLPGTFAGSGVAETGCKADSGSSSPA